MKTRLPVETIGKPISCIPQDILEAHIYKALNKTELGSLLPSCKFFYNSTQQYKKKLVEAIPRNLQQRNCNKRMFNSEGGFGKIARWKNILVISSDDGIQAFNVYTGKPLWSYKSTEKSGSILELWVMQNGNVICWCQDYGSFDRAALAIDIKTGNCLGKIGEEMFPRHELIITVAGNQIILKLKNSIGFWDLANKKTIRTEIQNLGNCMPDKFLANERFIVSIDYTDITVIQHQSSKLISSKRYKFETCISSAVINNHSLMCGEESGSGFIFDMEQGKIIEKYQFPDDILKDLSEWGKCITSVAVNEQCAFMVPMRGQAVAFNRQNKQTYLLDKSGELFLQDNMLFIQKGFVRNEGLLTPPSFDMWNTESMKKVNTFVGTYGQWHNGELSLVSENNNSVINYDFKVLHEGEVLAEEYRDGIEQDNLGSANLLNMSNTG